MLLELFFRSKAVGAFTVDQTALTGSQYTYLIGNIILIFFLAIGLTIWKVKQSYQDD